MDYRNGTCSLHYFQEEKLNKIVFDRLRTMILNHSNEDELQDKYNSKNKDMSNIKDFEKELGIYKNKIEIIEKAISDLYMDRAKGVLTTDDFYKIKTGLDNDRKRHQEKVQDIETMLFYNKAKETYDNY